MELAAKLYLHEAQLAEHDWNCLVQADVVKLFSPEAVGSLGYGGRRWEEGNLVLIVI